MWSANIRRGREKVWCAGKVHRMGAVPLGDDAVDKVGEVVCSIGEQVPDENTAPLPHTYHLPRTHQALPRRK